MLVLMAGVFHALVSAGIVEESGVKGGLVVHLGCGDGTTTAELRRDDRFVVHGLDADAENVKKAREHIRAKGLYGKVSVDTFDGKNLPYVDGVVNLVVLNSGFHVPRTEIERVLAPRGVLVADSKSRIQNPEWRKPGRRQHYGCPAR